MGKYDVALRKLQAERIEKSTQISDQYLLNQFNEGYISGIEKAEEILYGLQQHSIENGKKLWYTGSPNDLKPNNKGTYILVMKAHFSNDEITEGQIYVDADYWDGEQWEDLNVDEDGWEVLYFTKLKWLKFPLPSPLGMKRSDKMFIQ